MSEETKTVSKEELVAQAEELKKQDEEAVESGAEVTTVAAEEAKAGDPESKMSVEQTREMAHMNLFYGLQALKERLPDLSRRALHRLVIAWMQLPVTEGKMQHNFQKTLEKECFAIGQNVLSSKYGILYDHITQKAMEERLAKKAESNKPEEKTETKEESKNDNDK